MYYGGGTGYQRTAVAAAAAAAVNMFGEYAQTATGAAVQQQQQIQR